MRCTGLTNVTIPDSVAIGSAAFAACEGLTVTYKGKQYTYNNPHGNSLFW
jgi:hypothetical protein